ncbi:hypothetical protein AB5I41_22875 [Sphingomonas sp. MMS24-JH45]
MRQVVGIDHHPVAKQRADADHDQPNRLYLRLLGRPAPVDDHLPPHVNGSTVNQTVLAYSGAGVLQSAQISDWAPAHRPLRQQRHRPGHPPRGGREHEHGRSAPRLLPLRRARTGTLDTDGTFKTDYATSVADRTAAQGTGPFRNGASSGAFVADFDAGYDPITSYNQGSGGGSYRVRAGDTLRGLRSRSSATRRYGTRSRRRTASPATCNCAKGRS